jgi:hypothetical protein
MGQSNGHRKTPNRLPNAKAVALPSRSTARQSIVDALADPTLVLDSR